MSINRNTKYIFISAAGHSGSTLLDMMLGSNHRIESLGEITHLPKNLALNTRCTCGSYIKECNVWKKIIKTIRRDEGIDAETNPYNLDLGYINPKEIIDRRHQTFFYNVKQKIYLGFLYLFLRFGINPFPKMDVPTRHSKILYDAVRKARNVDAVVDSSKSYIKATRYYKAYPDNTKIIVLVRDGRGVFYSGLKRGYGRSFSLGSWLKHYSRSLSLYTKNVDSKCILFVKYEDLVEDTLRQLKIICEFIGMPYESAMLTYNTEHHITNGNNLRFNSSILKLDETWKSQLSEDDLKYFNNAAVFLNKKLGYK